MDIKNTNLQKMSKEKLYQVLVQKGIDPADREKVKKELVRREADELFNQAQRARKGEPARIFPKSNAAPQGVKTERKIRPATWIFLIFFGVLISIALYTMIFM